MANKTACDMRVHLASFEPEYPFKKGYITRLLVNDKLPVSDICRRITEIVQMAEPDKHVHQQRASRAIYQLKYIAQKKFNYANQRQWEDFVKLSQEPFGISVHDDATQSVDSSAVISAALMQSEHKNTQFVQPEHTNTQFVQPEHTSAPTPLQQTSETSVDAVVGLTSDSIHNELSFSVLPRSPSPKRLKRDCDNCVTKQRTSLNMLKENKSLRLQIRTLKQLHRQERKQMTFKRLNEKIKRQSQSATLWRSKYNMLMKEFIDTGKVNRPRHKTAKATQKG